MIGRREIFSLGTMAGLAVFASPASACIPAQKPKIRRWKSGGKSKSVVTASSFLSSYFKQDFQTLKSTLTSESRLQCGTAGSEYAVEHGDLTQATRKFWRELVYSQGLPEEIIEGAQISGRVFMSVLTSVVFDSNPDADQSCGVGAWIDELFMFEFDGHDLVNKVVRVP